MSAPGVTEARIPDHYASNIVSYHETYTNDPVSRRGNVAVDGDRSIGASVLVESRNPENTSVAALAAEELIQSAREHPLTTLNHGHDIEDIYRPVADQHYDVESLSIHNYIEKRGKKEQVYAALGNVGVGGAMLLRKKLFGRGYKAKWLVTPSTNPHSLAETDVIERHLRTPDPVRIKPGDKIVAVSHGIANGIGKARINQLANQYSGKELANELARAVPAGERDNRALVNEYHHARKQLGASAIAATGMAAGAGTAASAATSGRSRRVDPLPRQSLGGGSTTATAGTVDPQQKRGRSWYRPTAAAGLVGSGVAGQSFLERRAQKRQERVSKYEAKGMSAASIQRRERMRYAVPLTLLVGGFVALQAVKLYKGGVLVNPDSDGFFNKAADFFSVTDLANKTPNADLDPFNRMPGARFNNDVVVPQPFDVPKLDNFDIFNGPDGDGYQFFGNAVDFDWGPFHVDANFPGIDIPELDAPDATPELPDDNNNGIPDYLEVTPLPDDQFGPVGNADGEGSMGNGDDPNPGFNGQPDVAMAALNGDGTEILGHNLGHTVVGFENWDGADSHAWAEYMQATHGEDYLVNADGSDATYIMADGNVGLRAPGSLRFASEAIEEDALNFMRDRAA